MWSDALEPVVGALALVSNGRHVLARDSQGEAVLVVSSDNEVGGWQHGAGGALVRSGGVVHLAHRGLFWFLCRRCCNVTSSCLPSCWNTMLLHGRSTRARAVCNGSFRLVVQFGSLLLWPHVSASLVCLKEICVRHLTQSPNCRKEWWSHADVGCATETCRSSAFS